MKKTITIDFDSTLTKKRWNILTEQFETISDNHDLVDLIHCFRSRFNVAIVTSRNSKNNNNDLTNFLVKHGLSDLEVHFTNGEHKSHTLDRLNSIMHFDDDVHEFDVLSKMKRICALVPPPIGTINPDLDL